MKKKTYLQLESDKFSTLFKENLVHRKKLIALKNYSFCAPVKNQEQIKLLESCVAQGFLEEEEERFINHMINKYFGSEIEGLVWSHKTKFLKKKMQQIKSQQDTISQITFAFSPKEKLDLNTAKGKAIYEFERHPQIRRVRPHAGV